MAAKKSKKGNGIENVKGYHKNPRYITKHQYTVLSESLKKYGDISGIVHDLNSNEIISGNQRNSIIDLEQCEITIVEQYETPTDVGTVALGYIIWNGEKYNYRQVRWTKEQCEAANIAANKVGGEFDFEILANEFPVEILFENGFEEKDFFGKAQKEKTRPVEDSKKTLDEYPSNPNILSTDIQEGDLIEIRCSDGRIHRLCCGDSTDKETVSKLMQGEKAVFVHAQIPELVNEMSDNRTTFFHLWLSAYSDYLSDYASMMLWGNIAELWSLWYNETVLDDWALKNEIVLVKTALDSLQPLADKKETNNILRTFPKASERAFFLTRNLKSDYAETGYWEGWEPIREYLADEAKKMGWKATQIHELCHVKGMFKYWFSKDEFELIPQHHYEILQGASEGKAFLRNWEDLKAQYDKLKKYYDVDFPHFDIKDMNVTDIWHTPTIGNMKNIPFDAIEQSIKICARVGAIVLSPFLRDGAILSAGHQLGRVVYGMDKNPVNIAMAIDRLITIDRDVEIFKNSKQYSLEIETF